MVPEGLPIFEGNFEINDDHIFRWTIGNVGDPARGRNRGPTKVPISGTTPVVRRVLTIGRGPIIGSTSGPIIGETGCLMRGLSVDQQMGL